jgi:hypothetical protein
MVMVFCFASLSHMLPLMSLSMFLFFLPSKHAVACKCVEPAVLFFAFINIFFVFTGSC